MKRASLATASMAWALLALVSDAGASVDSPAVSPVTGGAGVPLVFGHFADTDAIHYTTTEYFFSGDAHSFGSDEPLGSDGRWDAVEIDAATAPYTSRVVVYAPKRRHRFNGTVYLEWLNVSGGVDASPDWTHGHLQVARSGAAWVLVSAQQIGVRQLENGNPIAPGDPERYEPLDHPGDSYSYDIFSQAAQAVRDGKLLGPLAPERVIAVGESQSAGRLVTYVNAVQPLADVFDGFLIHSRGNGGAPLRQAPLDAVATPATDIRDDIDAKVIVFQAEGDVANAALGTRQDETADGNFRLWEVTGTAHFDTYGLVIGPTDDGRGGLGALDNFAALRAPVADPQPGLIECAEGINAGPMHWVFNAAVRWIDRWVEEGTPPPIAPRLRALTAPGERPVVFDVDVHGNVKGGIRTPYVDVPVAMLTGSGNTGAPGAPPTSSFCFLFGQTVPFSDEKLAELYPNRGRFLFPYLLSTLRALQSQYLLWPDAIELFVAAARSDVGRP